MPTSSGNLATLRGFDVHLGSRPRGEGESQVFCVGWILCDPCMTGATDSKEVSFIQDRPTAPARNEFMNVLRGSRGPVPGDLAGFTKRTLGK
jgi:hypothetical protein